MEQNLNCVSSTELQSFILPTINTQFFPKSSMHPTTESSIHKNGFRKKIIWLKGWKWWLHHMLWHRIGMNLHLQKRRLAMHFVVPIRASTVDRLSRLTGLLHPLTLIQNCFTCCIVCLLLEDEKGVNSQVEV